VVIGKFAKAWEEFKRFKGEFFISTIKQVVLDKLANGNFNTINKEQFYSGSLRITYKIYNINIFTLSGAKF
jgi:hypothetical protein